MKPLQEIKLCKSKAKKICLHFGILADNGGIDREAEDMIYSVLLHGGDRGDEPEDIVHQIADMFGILEEYKSELKLICFPTPNAVKENKV